MKLIKTKDAIGCVLCHDITQIIKGVSKDAVFKKGHVVKAEDIPVLLSVGKDHLYVLEDEAGMIHENDAADILTKLCQGDNIDHGSVKEGKIELFALCDGILKINREELTSINQLGQMMIASRHGNTFVKKGDKLAGTRIIPLLIEEEKMQKAKQLAPLPIFNIKKIKNKKIAVITTGNEVYYGRIEDTFTPVIKEKLAEYEQTIMAQTILNDDHSKITAAIIKMIEEKKADMIICTGGMSVDPDDRTPLAIKNTGAKIVSYGAPVLPGAMFMLAYYQQNIPIVGLPGCVMYAKRTIFDLVLPRLLADDKIESEELAKLGEGGLCLNCEHCTYPNCGFGKGH